MRLQNGPFPCDIIDASAWMKIPKAHKMYFNYCAIIHYEDNRKPEQSDGGFIITEDEMFGTWILPEAKNLKIIKFIELRFPWEYTVYNVHYHLHIVK